jgi:hypothetical protein
MSPTKMRDEFDDRLLTAADGLERREDRYAFAIEVVVEAIGQGGVPVRERTITDNVSNWGCRFFVPFALRLDDIVTLRPASQDSADPMPVAPTFFQVVRVNRQGDGWMVAAWRISEDGPWSRMVEKAAQRREPSLETSAGEFGTGKTGQGSR